MLELKKTDHIARKWGDAPYVLFSLRCAERDREDVPYLFGKREEPLVRVEAAPAKSGETRVEVDRETLEYLATTFNVSELPPLRYFRIFIGKYSLPALVDSGSSRILFGDEGIEMV